MNSKLLVTGLLGLILTIGIQSAYADILIDDFTAPVSAGCTLNDSTNAAGGDTGSEMDASIRGGVRDCEADALSGASNAGSGGASSPPETMTDVLDASNEDFICNNDSSVTGECHVEYGMSGPGMNMDLSGATTLVIGYLFVDQPHWLTVMFSDGAITASTIILVPGSPTPSNFNIDLPSLFFGTGIVDTDVDELSLWINTMGPAGQSRTQALNVEIDFINVEEMIGGEMIPVDTSALLLAGAEMNSYWILPLIGAIGVGAFIYSRKRN